MTTVHVTGERLEETSTVGSFLSNLPEMLGAWQVDPRCLVAVIEFEDGRYVQFWVTSDGVVIAEVVSNLNIKEAVALTSACEALLRESGWHEPSPGPTPNWRFEARDRAGLVQLIRMVQHAVLHVLAETRDRLVFVRSWSMGPPHDRRSDDLLYEGRVYYQEALHEMRERLLDL